MSESSSEVQTSAEAKRILDSLISSGILELRPTLDKEGIRYTNVEKYIKDAQPIHITTILQNLEKQGLIVSKIVDRVITCPDCSSPDIHSRYACPKCDSHNIERTDLIEHIQCGYIGSKDKLVKDSTLICPRCQNQIDGDRRTLSYREIGSCYQCEKCGYRFDEPKIMHLCQKCRRTFTYENAKYIKISSFTITEKAMSDFRRDTPIMENISRILTEKGFKVHLHPAVTGSSGVQHKFDILAEKNEIRLVIDISLTGNKNDMISLLGKKVDVNPTKALIVDLSGLDELPILGRVYDIIVLKAENVHDLMRHVEKPLSTMEEKPKKIKAENVHDLMRHVERLLSTMEEKPKKSQ